MANNFNLTLSEETTAIFFRVGQQLKLPAELGESEQLELILEAVADSIDTQMEVATAGHGEPLNMQDALEKILNPDISTDFVQPQTITLPAVELTYEQLEPEIVRLGIVPPSSAIGRKAFEIVFNKLPESEWGSDVAESMITQTVTILQKNKSEDTTENH